MKRLYLKKMLFSVFFLLISQLTSEVFAQKNGSTQRCDSSVPFFSVDLTGSPDSVWTSPWHSRNGYCCGSSGNSICTSFELKLDSAVSAITIEILGAVPPGALYYQIDCGPEIRVGEDICIQGGGTHLITFCKPGNNSNQYIIRSMSKPDVPEEIVVFGGCTQQISTYGFNESTITWKSIYPGVEGDYNHYLSCTDCAKPLFTADNNAPEYIDYVVCGSAKCGNFLYACDTVRIKVDAKPLNISSTNVSCHGGSDGSAQVNFTGTGTLTYKWSSGEKTAEISGKAVGQYTVEVTVNGSCTLRDTVFISQPDLISVSIESNFVRTPDADNGSATANVTGNPEDFTFLWSTGDTTQTINNLTAGTYTVTVTDQNGCTATETVVIEIVPCEELQINLALTHVFCKGSADGSAVIESFNGVAPFIVSWSNGSDENSITELTTGEYSVTITGADYCSATKNFTISEPEILTVSYEKTDVYCHGNNSGSASISIDGGTAPYTIKVNDEVADSEIEYLSAGTYEVVVTDANNCQVNTTINIEEPTQTLNAEIVSQENILCKGVATGSATVNATGGSGEYIYIWKTTPVQNTATATNLAAGTYSIVIFDNNGCEEPIELQVEITEPQNELSAEVVSVNNVLCYGTSTGSATVQAKGGSGNYSYSWSTGINETATADNLSAGIYEVKIIDNNGCADAIVITVNIDQPEGSLIAEITSSQSVSCHDGDNGTATVSVSGGSGEYSYSWNTIPVQNTSTATGLMAGNYVVTITDLNGCNESVTASVNIDQPEPLNATAKVSSAKCGEKNGSALLEVTGGTQPYNYEWSNGDKENSTKDLATGSYTVLIKDNNMCEKLLVVEVDSITPMTIDAMVENIACPQEETGAIELKVEGGLAPYSFKWNTRNRGSNLNNLKAGTYTVTIKDASGCEVTHEYNVSQPEPMKINFQVSVYSNNHNISETGKSDGEILANITGGTMPYSWAWSNGQNTADLTRLPAGIYQVTVTDANGCPLNETIELTEPASIQIPNGFSPNGNGRNDRFVVKGIEDYPDNSLIVFNRWGNEVFSRDNYNNDWTGINNQGKELPQGTYFIILKVRQNGEEEVYKTYVELRK
jgi:gliding motility-associated-like protein